jgi:hypothetical protein
MTDEKLIEKEEVVACLRYYLDICLKGLRIGGVLSENRIYHLLNTSQEDYLLSRLVRNVCIYIFIVK